MIRLHTNITPLKGLAARPIVDVIILIIAIPVVAIALLSIVIYTGIYYLLTLFSSQTETAADTTFREEIPLVESKNVLITLIEDSSDEELTRANDSWAAEVYGRDTNLYRVKTEPVIAGVHGSICCFFQMEINGTAIIQQITQNLDTQLLGIDLETLTVSEMGKVGNFYLYRDENTPGRIRGINYSEEITIDLVTD